MRGIDLPAVYNFTIMLAVLAGKRTIVVRFRSGWIINPGGGFMRRLALALTLTSLLLGLTAPVWAQSQVVFDQMTIEVWPEYDRPDVLVIYRIQLANDVSLPAQVSLLIPREAGDPYNVAFQDMDGLLYNLQYTKEVQGDYIKIVFSTPTTGIHLEYYDPRLNRDADQRQFNFEWVADYTVNNLSIAVQQPLNASGMQILPTFGAGQLKEDGLMYYTTSIGKVNAGQKISIELRYSKPDDQLSVGLQPVQPAEPLDAGTPGKTRAGDLVPWILGGLGVVLLVGGFSWFWFTRSQVAAAPAARRRHRAIAERRDEPAVENAVVYCHQCGRRAAPGDLFCRTCGTRLRGE